MTWLNPVALIGLLAVALPLLIHLLGRGHAKVYRFPTLRFLDASRLLPTRRTRLRDLPLLLVRAAILALASLALAQPLWLTAARTGALDRGLARAIVVDTSASAAQHADVAQRLADSLARAASVSVIVKAADVPGALPGAVHWLERQSRRGEIAIVSDFIRGTVGQSDVARVPVRFGVILVRSPAGEVPDAGPLASEAARDTRVTLLTGDADRDDAAAALTAAATIPIRLPIDTTRAIAVVFRSYAGARALRGTLGSVNAPWMADLLWMLRVDSLPVDAAGVANVNGAPHLVLFASAEPGTLGSARIIAAARQATSIAPPLSELETERTTDAELASWRRAPSPAHAIAMDAGTSSDARWVWLAVLVLMLIELRMRRNQTDAAERVEAPARAA